MLPVSGCASTGVVIETVPTFDASGHLIASVVPSANCTSVHACSPVADGGLIVSPAGSVPTASRTCEVAMCVGSWSCGTCRSTPTPVGVSCCVVPGVTEIDGVNGTWSQPVAPVGVVSVAVAVWPAYESSVHVLDCGPAQSVGSVLDCV